MTNRAALILVVAGCYGAAPPRPPQIPLPPIVDGVELAVQSDTKTTIEQVPHTAWSCPNGSIHHDSSCIRHDYTEAEPVTRTKTTAKYGDDPVSIAQFVVMTDDKRPAKLAELDGLSHRCTRANIPRYAGIAALVGGLVAGIAVAKGTGDDTLGQSIMYAGAGIGLASYGLGYFAFGGADCVRARHLYETLDVSRDVTTMSIQGAKSADGMKILAEKFNAVHGRHAKLGMR
jgi:hypothetical protein